MAVSLGRSKREEGALAVLQVVLEATYLVVFAVVLARFLRHPDALGRDVVLVFATFAAMTGTSLLLRALPDAPPGSGLIIVIALLIQPPLTLRLAAHVGPRPRWVMPVAWGAALAALLIVLTGSAGTDWGRAVVLAIILSTDLAAVVSFARAAHRRVGLARLRLSTSAVATTMFAAAIVVLGTLAVSTAGADMDRVTLVVRLLALAAGIGFLVAFVPPTGLLQPVQRAVAFDWQERMATAARPSQDRAAAEDAIWQALAEAAREVSSTNAAVVRVGGRTVASSGFLTGSATGEASDGGPRSGPVDRIRSIAADADAEVVVDLHLDGTRCSWTTTRPWSPCWGRRPCGPCAGSGRPGRPWPSSSRCSRSANERTRRPGSARCWTRSRPR